jgi:amidohydrolase
MKNLIKKTIAQESAELKKLALAIHGRPELGFQEKEACARQIELLKKWGFKVEHPYAGLTTAFKAVAGSTRPVIAFMSEYDALPEIGHACGHNLIAGAALGAGLALARALKVKKQPGTVVIMGTPAEESKGGKVVMIKNGALRGLDAVLMAHPNAVTRRDVGSSAIQRFTVAYRGLAAHAADSPELGRNALDAVMLFFHGVNAWRQQLPESCRIHGVVRQGGVAPNIIPAEASADFFLRALKDQVLDEMVKRFKNIAKGAALMTDCRLKMTPLKYSYMARNPNKILNLAFLEEAERLGMQPDYTEEIGRASSDFGDVSQAVPGVHVAFGIAADRGELAAHSVAFREAAASAYGLSQMLKVAAALACVGARFLREPEFRRQVKEAFIKG